MFRAYAAIIAISNSRISFGNNSKTWWLLPVFWLLLNPVWAVTDNAGRQLDSLQQCLTHYGQDTNRVKVLINMASAYTSRNNYVSLTIANQAFKLADSLNFTYGKALSTGNIGNVYEIMGDYQEALRCYLKVLRYSEEINDNRTKAISLSYIGNIYMWLKKEDLAKKYYKDGLNLCLKEGMKNSYGIACNNLGIIAFRQKKWQEAIDYYNLAIASAAYSNQAFLASPYTNLGEIYVELHLLDSGKYYYRKGLEFQSKPVHYVDCNIGLGRIFIEEGKYREARECLYNSMAMAHKTGVRSYLPDIYKYLSLLYRKQHDYKQAFHFYELYHAMSDSIYNEESARQINDAQSRYELEKKDKEIRLLAQTRQTAEAQADSQKILRNFFIAAFIFIFIVSLVLVRNVVLKQKLNKVLLEKNERIETDNSILLQENAQAKYETLKSKINPHFLFNSLTTLSSIVSDDKESAIIYIERFSELYRMILETGDQKLVTLKEEMEVVQNYLYLQSIRYESDLTLNVQIPAACMNDYVPPFSVQMITENAIKHNMISEDYRMNLDIVVENDEIIVRNTLQKRHNKPSSTGIGQKNIIERYRLLSRKEPVFMETEDRYIAKLPLIRKLQPTEETTPA